MELTFWSGVYGPCLGFTKSLGENYKSMPGLHGIMIGVGEIASGLIFGIFGKYTNMLVMTMTVWILVLTRSIHYRFGRWPVVVLGTVLQFTAFVLVFLNIPPMAPVDGLDAEEPAIINPSSVPMAIVSSLLLGFGDACYNTQTLSLLGKMMSLILTNQKLYLTILDQFRWSVSGQGWSSFCHFQVCSVHCCCCWLHLRRIHPLVLAHWHVVGDGHPGHPGLYQD